jgi:hypothetical protein
MGEQPPGGHESGRLIRDWLKKILANVSPLESSPPQMDAGPACRHP